MWQKIRFIRNPDSVNEIIEYLVRKKLWIGTEAWAKVAKPYTYHYDPGLAVEDAVVLHCSLVTNKNYIEFLSEFREDNEIRETGYEQWIKQLPNIPS